MSHECDQPAMPPTVTRKPSNDLDVTNVKAFLQESGLNAQLIDKNDKKLIKLNVTSSNHHHHKFNTHDSLGLKQSKSNSQQLNNTPDIDIDLPSLSDVSACTTVVLMPSSSTPSSSKFTEQQQKSKAECTLANESEPNAGDSHSPNSSLSETTSNKDQLTDSEEASATTKRKLKKRIFICNECGRQFHSQNDLNKHMLQLHETQKPFECSQCHMTFYDVSSKRRHEKEHSGYKPFRCYICSFEFTRASNLRAHLLKVHPNDVGKSVHITKSIDNKLKFEFNLGNFNFLFFSFLN